jgi:hypothetical protein
MDLAQEVNYLCDEIIFLLWPNPEDRTDYQEPNLQVILSA